MDEDQKFIFIAIGGTVIFILIALLIFLNNVKPPVPPVPPEIMNPGYHITGRGVL